MIDRTGQVLDKYRLLRLLGRGGFADVWQCLYVYKEHKSELFAVVWSPDGTRIASAGDDKMVRVWQAV